MKQYILVIILLFSSIVARGGTTHTIYMKVGETQTLTMTRIPNYLKGTAWTSSRPYDVVITSSMYPTTTSVIIRAEKSFSGAPCVIHCLYYYLELDPATGRYTYQRSDYEDWNVYVEEVEPTSVSVSPNNIEVDYGTSQTVSGSVYPPGAKMSLTWRSLDSKVASVRDLSDGRARITAEGPGSCRVSVRTHNGLEAYVYVTVPPVPESIRIPSSLTVAQGGSKTLSVEITPPDAKTSLVWKTGDSSIATVSNGTVYGKAPGETSISVSTSNGKSAFCSVTVTPPVAPTSISLSAQSINVTEGYGVWLQYKMKPDDATSKLTWNIDDVSVLTPSYEGYFIANKPGEAKVRIVTENGKEASCMVKVKEASDNTALSNVKPKVNVLSSKISETAKYL